MPDIVNFERAAEEILALKRVSHRRRPVVIEFSGSPKSGKTSCIHSLRIFLERNGIQVAVVADPSSQCPVKDRHSPAYYTWTAGATLNALGALLGADGPRPDVVLCDRGVFDALCWLKWMRTKGVVEREEYDAAAAYLTLSRWAGKIDLVCVFESSPRVSIERENTFLLTRKADGIMNLLTLSEYINCIEDAGRAFGTRFRRLQRVDTTSMDQNTVSRTVAGAVLTLWRELLEERSGVISRSELEAWGFPLEEASVRFWQEGLCLPSDKITFPAGTEEADGLLRVEPVGVFVDRERARLLTFQCGGVHRAWFGGTLLEEDRTGATSLEDMARAALKRELEEALGISVALGDLRPCCLYTPAEGRRLAVCFLVERELDGLRAAMAPAAAERGLTVELRRREELGVELKDQHSRMILEQLLELGQPVVTAER